MNSVRNGNIGWLFAAALHAYPGYRCIIGNPLQDNGEYGRFSAFFDMQDYSIAHIGMIGTGLLFLAIAGAMAYYAILIKSRC